jgi:hypothetical protein
MPDIQLFNVKKPKEVFDETVSPSLVWMDAGPAGPEGFPVRGPAACEEGSA